MEASHRFCSACSRSFPSSERQCPDDGTPLVLIRGEDPLLGRTIDGRFQVTAMLGQGGMGSVYRARQLSVGRDVALKVISPERVNNATTVKRFLREVQLTSRVVHRNVVTVLDFGQTDDGLLYLVLELVAGRPLDDVLAAEGPFSVARMARVGAQICDALDAAHRLGIVHRDLKPSNVLLQDEPAGRDHLKVLDFGLARPVESGEVSSLTLSGMVCGTPAYLSPEGAKGLPTDARSDLYSLGVLLHELLTGRRPFEASPLEVLMLHVTEPPPPIPGVPAVVEAVIHRLLSKEPAERFGSAATCREALLALEKLPESPRARLLSATATELDLVPVPVRFADHEPSYAAAAGETASVVAVGSPARRSSRWLVPVVAVVLGGAVTWWLWPPRSRPSPVPVSPVEATAVAPPTLPVSVAPSVAPSVQPTTPPSPAVEPKPSPVPSRSSEEAAPRRERAAFESHPAEVALELKSRPSPAVFVLGDGRRGQTPNRVMVRYGTTPIEVAFQRNGQTLKKTVTPDRSQDVESLFVAAARAPPKVVKETKPSAPPKQPWMVPSP